MSTTYRRRPSDLDRDTAAILAVLARQYNHEHDLDRLEPDHLNLDPIDPYERTSR